MVIFVISFVLIFPPHFLKYILLFKKLRKSINIQFVTWDRNKGCTFGEFYLEKPISRLTCVLNKKWCSMPNKISNQL